VSDLHVTGTCHFVDQSPGKCVARPGDYYVYVHHSIPGGVVILTVNVEGYDVPRTYHAAQVNLQVTRSGKFFYWFTTRAEITILPSQLAVSVPGAVLEPQAGTPARGEIHVDGVTHCPQLG